MRDEWLYNEGVDGANAAVHVNHLSHAGLYEAFHTRNIQVQAYLYQEGACSHLCLGFQIKAAQVPGKLLISPQYSLTAWL